MNKYLPSIAVILFTSLLTYSQAPGIFNYQGIARNSVGNVLENKTITLRLSIHDISSAGPLVYQESRTVTTNPFGLFNIQVGSSGANNVTGSIATVNWATGNKYLKVEIDPAGGSSFINLGVSQLASVPYSLSSGDNYWRKNGNDIYKINSGNVGIGTDNPLSNLHIKSNQSATLMLQGNGNFIDLIDIGGERGLIYSGGLGMHILQYGGGIRFGTSSDANFTLERLTITREGNIGINNSIPNSSSKLDIQSNNSGLLIPRMTEAQRNAISGPATSLMIYQTDNTPGFYHYDGNAWTRFNTGTINSYWQANGNNIYNSNTANVGIGTNIPNYKLSVIANDRGIVHTSTDGQISIGTNASNDFGYFGTFSNTRLGFLSNNLLAMTILPNRNVGIGTALPLARLHINSVDEALRLSGNNAYMSFHDGNGYQGFLGITDNHVELGTPSNNTNGKIIFYRKGIPLLTLEANSQAPSFDYVKIGAVGPIRFTEAGLPKLSIQGGPICFKKRDGDQIGEWAIGYGNGDNMGVYFNGGIKGFFANTNGTYVPLSDFRLKENIEFYKPVLKDIKKLNVLTYNYKADNTRERTFGLIAQNLQPYFPELVASSGGKEKYLGVDYSKIGVLAIKAIQEQQVIIEEQQKRIETLEKRLAALESKLR